ncbi:MAG: hypothetical protein NZT92_18170 [Abditibacteriales bacterium]|nr:hypothetical protein [Abditibacteriales bacterium]MDW8367734.1 hypothetical protein [Abditibacteriales bacterium]
MFETDDGKFHSHRFDEMATLVHRSRRRTVRNQLQPMPSVIGHDILNHYTFVQEARTGLVLLTDEILNRDGNVAV